MVESNGVVRQWWCDDYIKEYNVFYAISLHGHFFAICVLPTDISDIAVNSNATGQKREKLKEKYSTVLYPHIIA